jgi:hypothetical protein
MKIEALIKLRPFVFHTTASANLEGIRLTRTIDSTRRILALAGRVEDPLLRERRRESVAVAIDGREVSIRDQKPLHVGAIAFEQDWDLARFVELLNGFAFFWPGDETEPIPYGRSHFQRYESDGEALAVLRVPTAALFAANRARRVLFSRCNSGSARVQGGKGVPRGESTFCAAEAFAETAGCVKEIVIEGWAELPAGVMVARDFGGDWQPLWPVS